MDTTKITIEPVTIEPVTIEPVTIEPVALELPAVRWEPCPEFRPNDGDRDTAGIDDSVCAGCGWSADDHELAAAA